MYFIYFLSNCLKFNIIIANILLNKCFLLIIASNRSFFGLIFTPLLMKVEQNKIKLKFLSLTNHLNAVSPII